ncbi:MAG: DNA polymerase III subunit delta [Clostridia bacterium]|nr:DNA polymerase III subunit delta [Clostridia bacterium]
MQTTIENLETDLKQGKLNSIYLLYGEETFLLDSCLKKIKSNFGELITGINYIKIDEGSVNSLVSDMETPAFGYEKKLIIARDTGLFKKDGRKKVQANSEIVNKINTYIEENIDIINDSVVLVFIEQEADKNDLFSTIEKLGIICNFEELKPAQISTRMKSICNAYKVNIDNYAIQYLIESVGCNMQDLINEIRKQIEYAGANGTITKESIDLLCIKKLDAIIFDLTDNLGKKNTSKALEVLNGLIYNKEPIQKILVTLYNHFKKLYIVKLCVNNNENITDALNLKANQTFLVSKYKTQAGYFKEQELRKILEELINLDSNYKIGLIDINIGLESILCRYC